MQETIPSHQSSSNKPIWYFLLFWTALNVIQSYTLEVHGDEAYYWMYSRFLDWGYFDHPPMVAVFIKIGDSLMHNELGLRLLTVITNSCSLYLLWLILKKYAVDAKWFILVVSGLFIFHMYGFTTTPDSPLLFFTVLFYYCYQRYIEDDLWYLAILLAVITACLLYSKYHGILLIGFTVLSNIKLLKRKTFWFIAIGAFILYLPHILWQVHHDFPSIKYHLFDRSADRYHFEFTYLYPLGQLAMAGPLIGWFLFYSAFKIKIQDGFIRALVVNCIGTFLFFMLSTFKGEVQLHWTLIAFVPLIMLVLISFKQRGNPPQWFYKLGIANIALILFIRAALLFQFPFVMNIGPLKSYFGFRLWAKHVHQRIGNAYLIIPDGFQDPSKYNYYTNSIRALSYDSRYYRKTQYDIWPIEDSLQHKRVYCMMGAPLTGVMTDSIKEQYDRIWYGSWVDDARTYQKVQIEVDHAIQKVSAGKTIVFNLVVNNPYSYPINFSNTGHQHHVFMEACFFQNKDLVYTQNAGSDFNTINLKPGEKTKYQFRIKTPIKKGKYDLLFSIRTTPFEGSRNSVLIEFVVE